MASKFPNLRHLLPPYDINILHTAINPINYHIYLNESLSISVSLSNKYKHDNQTKTNEKFERKKKERKNV